ncbi:hypothetical protein L204_100296 [Cryptococcus depauperatus]|nr:hypothetical protein L204_02224 [Cryptococcus depauperatus CBS 7855]
MNHHLTGHGLPGKPYTQGSAPPLPAGPPPAQSQQTNTYGQTPEQAAAHAAAWAAYYQSQGASQQTTYTALPTTAQPTTGATPTVNNPYANYGYGPNAQHAKPAPSRPPQGYRPPPNTQAYTTTATQPTLGYQQPQQPQPYGQQQYPQGFQAPYQPAGAPAAPQVNQGYTWNQTQQPGHRPPQQPVQPQTYPNYTPQTAPYYGQQAAQYTPSPQQGNYRPPAGPVTTAPGHSSPFRPPNPMQNRPIRPPSSQTGLAGSSGQGSGGFPPAKRPRFDGPGGNNQNRMNNNARPPPSVGTGSGFNAPSGPGGNRNVSVRGPPVSRPPIRMGGGPSPVMNFSSGFGGNKGPVSMRGLDRATRGRGGGPTNAPRGPANMRRPDSSFNAPHGPSQYGKSAGKEGKKDVVNKKRNQKEIKGNMTDFRIIGVELGGLGWSWGIVNGKIPALDEKAEDVLPQNDAPVDDEKTEIAKTDTENGNIEKVESEQPAPEDVQGDLQVSEVKIELRDEVEAQSKPAFAEDESKDNVIAKAEPDDQPESTELTEDASASTAAFEVVALEAIEEKEKRGEKRKAKSPDAEDESHPQKRAAYLLTHKKPNPSANSNVSDLLGSAGLLAKYESNSNRFRIYFDSPPELDRAPKAAKKAANAAAQGEKSNGKRWRRDSTVSVVLEKSGKVAVPGSSNSAKHDNEGGDEIEAEVEATAEGEGHTELETEISVVERNDSNTQDNDHSQQAPAEIEQVEADDQAGVEHTLGEGCEDECQQNHPAEAPENAAIFDSSDGTVNKHENEQTDIEPTETKEIDDLAEVGDVSMRTDTGPAEAIESADTGPVVPNDQPVAAVNELTSIVNEMPTQETDGNVEGPQSDSEHNPASTTAATAILTESAANTISAYRTRSRRHSSVSTSSEHPLQSHATHSYLDKGLGNGTEEASWNRISIVWEESLRRLCLDVDVVERVKMWRKEGKIEVHLKPIVGKDDEKETGIKNLPKGILLEVFDQTEQQFVPYTAERLAEIHSSPSPDQTLPPLHLVSPNLDADGSPLTVTVFLNRKSPLSEPKWVKNNQADAWLYEQFESRKGVDAGWRGKLEVMDPDPAPTLQSILDNWASNCTLGTPSSRRAFISSLASSPNDLLEILLRLTRGERNPALGSTSSFGPFAALIKPDSPFASHQTHVSLAILAMYRLTTDYAQKAGDSVETVDEKIGDIIKSLPVMLITKSLDGLFKEWQGGDGK